MATQVVFRRGFKVAEIGEIGDFRVLGVGAKCSEEALMELSLVEDGHDDEDGVRKETEEMGPANNARW